jgi:hypothetical protein
LIAAALVGVYFISGIGMIGEQLVVQATEWLGQGPVQALHEQAEADQVSVQDAALVRQAPPTPVPEARQSSENEPRQEVSAKEPAGARHAVDEVKLQAEAATTAQSLGQEREKMAALMQDADAARQALTASTAQHREALEKEHARGDALASEVAAARRDLDTKVALLGEAHDVVAQLKQAAEARTADLQQESARNNALASELAKARRDVETQVALSNKRGDEAAQLKQAAESATAELRQSLQQEHARAEALATELTNMRRNVEQKPAAVEERPGVSLPAWTNSYALVEPALIARRPDVAPENSKLAFKPVETVPSPKPRGRAMSQDNGSGCQHYRTYDPASGSYTGYDGRHHSCP